MADPKLKAWLELDTTRATNSMRQAESKLASSARNIVTSFVGPIASIAALTAGVHKAIAASIEHEQAMARVKHAGIANVRAFDQWAERLQRVSAVSSDVIATQAAITKSLGASEDQAKLFTEAALELAATLGRDVVSVQNQLNKTLGGTLGELAELVPSMKELTAEQLKAGDAAKFIMEQFGGSAAAQVATFGGSVRNVSEAFSDMLQAIGDVMTGQGNGGNGLNALVDALDDVTGWITWVSQGNRGAQMGALAGGPGGQGGGVARRYALSLGYGSALPNWFDRASAAWYRMNASTTSMEALVGRGFEMPGFRGRSGGVQSPESIVREELRRAIVLRPERVELQLGGLTDGGAFPGMPGPRGNIGATDLSGLPVGTPFEQPRMTGNDWLEDEIRQREYIRDLTEQSMGTLTNALLDSIFYARDLSDVFRNLARDIAGSLVQTGVRAFVSSIIPGAAAATASAGGGSMAIGPTDNNPTMQTAAREFTRQQAKARRRGF